MWQQGYADVNVNAMFDCTLKQIFKVLSSVAIMVKAGTLVMILRSWSFNRGGK